MLHVTIQAMDVIRDLIAANDTPAQGGLHIRLPTIPRNDVDRLEGVDLEVVLTAPPSTLQLRTGQDCRLFLDQDAAHYLQDKVLHATHDSAGAVVFVVTTVVPTEASGAEVAEAVPER